jgi:PAT family beta-lactamase induction signal transducer AmpG
MLILAYTIKPLFAPFVEMYRTKKFFVLCAQVLIGLGFAGVALAMGLPDYMRDAAAVLVMSFIGATQDIASDGVYVTSLDSRAQSLYCGVQSLSWNIGPIVASGFLVYLSGRLHTDVFHHDPRAFGPAWMDAWRVIFFIVAGITLLMALWHARVMPEGAARGKHARRSARRLGILLRDSFVTFFQKRGVWKMVAFAFLFRLSIGFLEKIGPFFMVDPAPRAGWDCRTNSWASSTAPTAWRRCCSAPCWAAGSWPARPEAHAVPAVLRRQHPERDLPG